MRWACAVVALSMIGCGDGGSGVPGGPQAGGEGGADASAATGASSGGSGGMEEPYEPEPIPELDEEPPAPCPDQTPSGSFQFLHDTCGMKRFPSDEDRELACPLLDESPVVALEGGGEVTYQSSAEPIVVDDALSGIVPDALYVTAILVRRVNGVPHYRYLSNGTSEVAYQPWSTTKFLAAANAAARLRIASSGDVGITAEVGGVPLGDLVTSIHNYDYAPYSSNSLGRYFHDIGTRDRANELIHSLWLDRPGSETFGGNYGEASPPLGYTFVEPGGGPSITINPDTSFGYANHLSSFTMAEALKRLVLHREEPDQRLPGIEWPDVQTVLYGAEGSAKYGAWGGMSADRAVYFLAGHDFDYIESRSKGRWRIFSKLGNGSDGQFLDVGYACLPVLDDELEPVPGWGREVIIAANLPTGGASWAERDRMLAKAFRAILLRVVDGRL